MRRIAPGSVWTLLALLFAQDLASQVSDPNAQYPRSVVEFDPGTRQVRGALPFGQPLLFKVPVPQGARRVTVDLGVPVFVGGSRALRDSVRLGSAAVPSGVLAAPALSFEVPPLEPRQDYEFRITYHVQSAIGLVATVPRELRQTVTGRTETTLASHFVTDIGALRTSEAGYWGAVTTLNFFLVPISRKESLACCELSDVLKRVSLFVGLTPVEIASDAPVDKLYKVGSPVAGVGLRLFRSLRVGAGVMFFEQIDANPLVDAKVGKHDSFVMLTVDLDYKGILGPVAALLGS